MTELELEVAIEAALLAAGRPVDADELAGLFDQAEDAPDRERVRAVIDALRQRWTDRSLEIVEVAGGYRAQVRARCSEHLGRLWAERPARYSRALLETLALVAYRQPITRGEIEEVRGVAVSTSIIKTLLEREWVRVLGHREVPGRPALYGTTRTFLDHFGLRSLQELPPLSEIRDLTAVGDDLFAAAPVAGEEPGLAVATGVAAGEAAPQQSASIAGAAEARTGLASQAASAADGAGEEETVTTEAPASGAEVAVSATAAPVLPAVEAGAPASEEFGDENQASARGPQTDPD